MLNPGPWSPTHEYQGTFPIPLSQTARGSLGTGARGSPPVARVQDLCGTFFRGEGTWGVSCAGRVQVPAVSLFSRYLYLKVGSPRQVEGRRSSHVQTPLLIVPRPPASQALSSFVSSQPLPRALRIIQAHGLLNITLSPVPVVSAPRLSAHNAGPSNPQHHPFSLLISPHGSDSACFPPPFSSSTPSLGRSTACCIYNPAASLRLGPCALSQTLLQEAANHDDSFLLHCTVSLPGWPASPGDRPSRVPSLASYFACGPRSSGSELNPVERKWLLLLPRAPGPGPRCYPPLPRLVLYYRFPSNPRSRPSNCHCRSLTVGPPFPPARHRQHRHHQTPSFPGPLERPTRRWEFDGSWRDEYYPFAERVASVSADLRTRSEPASLAPPPP